MVPAPLHNLTEMLPQGVFAIDPEGGVTYLNPAGCEALGVTPAELTEGINLFDFIDDAHRAYLRRRLAVIMEGAPGQLAEYRIRRKDGTPFPAMIHAARLLVAGEVIGLEGLLIDITHREQLENQLLQSQRMEALGVMASGIAHDFNNILSAVLGYTDISLTKIKADSPVHKHLARIREMCVRAIDIVKQILLFSRREGAGRQHVQLKLVARDAYKLIRASAPSAIEIALVLKSDAYVLADPTELHQIVMNLCTNAIQAMEGADGKLVIALTEVSADSSPMVSTTPAPPPASWIQLEVSDTGTGIPPEHLGRIFDPYFSTQTRSAATGLGLSAVHGIVTHNGGEIQVESERGKGASFRVRFPKAVAKSTLPDSAPHRAELPGGDEQILMVDDEAYLVDIAKIALTELGYKVTGITDPQVALTRFNEDPKRFDLVITDMTMPHLKGDRLAAHILEVAPMMPIILCTGQTDTCDHLRHTLPQIKTILKKPVPVEHLASVVRRTLDAPMQVVGR